MTSGDGHVAADPSGHVASDRVQTGTTERNNEKGRSHSLHHKACHRGLHGAPPHVPCRCSDPSVSSRTRGRVHLASAVPLFPWNDSARRTTRLTHNRTTPYMWDPERKTTTSEVVPGRNGLHFSLHTWKHPCVPFGDRSMYLVAVLSVVSVVVTKRQDRREREGGREKRSKTELLITGRAAFVDLFSLFLRCLKPQSVPRPLPLHGWRHRRKKGVSFPSAPHYYDVFPVPTQRHFVPDNDQKNSKSTASNCLETVQVPTFALPYQVMLSEKVQNEVRAVIVKEQEAQPLNIEKHNPEIEGIDLNRTPQQKPKRKKHRPKVIQEGKPTRTPKPRTPKLVTPKAAKMIEEGSTGKRKYVRKKIVLSSSDASSSMLVDNVVPDGTNRGKSVRRRLNFDSESMGARDACPGAAKAFEHCARLQTLDSCLHSTMQPDLQSQAMIENPGSGMTIDLDGSMNQMPYECVSYSEKPNPNFQPRRAEEMTTNQILNLCGSMPDKFVPQRENLNEISKNNNYIANTTTADRSHKTGKLSDSVGISIMILKGTKRDHNVVQDAPISDYTEFMHTVGGISQLSESPLYEHVNNWRANNRLLNNTPVVLEEQQTLEHILAFDKLERQRSDVKVQSHELDSVGSIADTICTSTPLKQSDCTLTGINHVSTPMKPHRGNDCQKDDNFKTENSKDAHVISTSNEVKPKRHAKKEEATVANAQSLSTDQIGLQGQKIASCNFDYSLVQKIPAFSVLIPGDCSENISHTKITYQCQNGSSFHNSAVYNLMSGALKPFGDPLDDIIEKVRHITLGEIHEDTKEKAENVIVPYDGGGVIVPYKGEFDLAKKRRPRPKVDLDAETFRVWNLLMGTGGNDSVVENDSEKEKHWEEERNVFHGRVDSFIARMHLVQG
ncbi:hypothetical protein GW17_00044524 [Ensete ventricosum]|nr:hypothetical protein GW17_00044524 [Ensete ventricosum]